MSVFWKNLAAVDWRVYQSTDQNVCFLENFSSSRLKVLSVDWSEYLVFWKKFSIRRLKVLSVSSRTEGMFIWTDHKISRPKVLSVDMNRMSVFWKILASVDWRFYQSTESEYLFSGKNLASVDWRFYQSTEQNVCFLEILAAVDWRFISRLIRRSVFWKKFSISRLISLFPGNFCSSRKVLSVDWTYYQSTNYCPSRLISPFFCNF